MKMNIISIADLKRHELESIIFNTKEIKEKPSRYRNSLDGRILIMLFEKPSLRTRISLESAMLQLGGNSIYIDRRDTHLGRGETIEDTARILSRYGDCIALRVNEHETILEFSENSRVPVINALSSMEHPCQIISDLFTIYEIEGKFKGINLAYIGDGNNVCNSLLLGCAILGVNIRVASPPGYEPDKEIIVRAIKFSRENNSLVEILENPREAVKGANFIYTDVWVSMGDEDEEKERLEAFKEYQINRELLKNADSDCKIMHCLPAHRGLEITDDVIDSENSIVWEQAENKLHAHKAILLKLLNERTMHS
ncbi:MAG: ornithine carbamoyltransferase [Candidatus Altiarchaeales archaeon]|nr:MAG: ornithine carbamoyltransferase [Candidatus Altiarchaeales archaeon]